MLIFTRGAWPRGGGVGSQKGDCLASAEQAGVDADASRTREPRGRRGVRLGRGPCARVPPHGLPGSAGSLRVALLLFFEPRLSCKVGVTVPPLPSHGHPED